MTDKSSVVIQSIEKNVVNQICSGQVILSLATAVKELVENSIDAGATSIQIRVKEYGSEMIEVIDNGCGVEEKNFQALTLKHYTSKISDFDDVSCVETFGFRGEALSSLCTLSKVIIITKHKNSLSGTRLKFDHNGIITESSKIARQTGTTVVLENIFCTLPVRQKEFLRNIKKEFTKMCNVLYAYGLLSKGVSIVCTNQVSSKKLPVMETMGEAIKSNIAQIFGAKQSQNILEIKKCAPEDIQLEDSSSQESKMKIRSLQDIDLEGFVSSCAHGSGRNSSDRQFYYINGRPVDNAKITKVVNDIYHQYNPHQYPFIVLNIKILMKYVDVNVTPDKRLIFMKNENVLLSIIQTSLHKLFQNIPAVMKLQNVGLTATSYESHQSAVVKEENNCTSPLEKLKQFRSSSYSNINGTKSDKKPLSLKEFSKSRSINKGSPSVREIFLKLETQSVKSEVNSKIDCEDSNAAVQDSDPKPCAEVSEQCSVTEIERHCFTEIPAKEISNMEESNIEEKGQFYSKRKVSTSEDNCQFPAEKTTLEEFKICGVKRFKTDDGMTETFKKNRKTMTIDVCINDIKQRLHDRRTNPMSISSSDSNRLRFHTQINPSQNENAEKELMKELSKESFKEMTIIGQFNLGFIITKLGPDIFIIDQHATDEKYNFEILQLNTKIQTQKLVIPQNLNLTIEKEELLLHHCDIIRQNGFDFTFDNNEVPTRRAKLTSVPLSKNWIFGKEDIDEMLFMLENAPDVKACRPSRVRDMFASRACRKSVMIGTPLNHFEMRRLVDHMAEIEQPWNCPHGRPTIRHLINLNMINQ